MPEMIPRQEGVYVPDASAGPEDLSNIVELEEKLARALGRAWRDVAHIEWPDEEQRAEIYTILQALRDDSQVHREALTALSGRASGERTNA